MIASSGAARATETGSRASATAVIWRCISLGLLGHIRSDGEDALAGEGETYGVLHIRRDALAERAQEIVWHRAAFRRQHVGGVAPEIGIGRRQVLRDPAAEQPARVPGVVHVHEREAGPGGEEYLDVGVAQTDDESGRRRHVPERVHPAGEERAGTRPDRR